jgi:4-amino-4-deoxy-L-arabinose transferase-like glycosyltransferase
MIEKYILRYTSLIIFALIALVYAFALPIPAMDIDASQYASIAKEMLQTGNFLQIWDRSVPYLDKPPLLFWLTAVSYQLFSVCPAASKLPTLLAWCMGLWATFRFARLYYDKNTARLAALILATTQAAFLMTNDVRTDTLLTASVALAIYFLAAATHDDTPQKQRFWAYFFGFSAVACAMLAKGPIGALVPAMALGGHWLTQKQWQSIFRWQWIVGVFVILVWLAPMTYGLYTQYDLNPTQIVNGKTGVSGVRFFYWTQSFGRITGESVWKNDTDALFLVHTTLWAFLPWALLMFWAFGKRCLAFFVVLKNYFKTEVKTTSETKNETTSETEHPQEWISFFGFLLPLIALSLSQYKLPHYIFVTYPMAAVFTAVFIQNLKNEKTWARIQYFLCNLLAITAMLICIYVFYNIYFILFSICSLLIVNILYFNKNFIDKIKTNLQLPYSDFITISLFSILCINTVLSLHFYPNLLRYQSGTEAGKYATANAIPLLYDATESGYAAPYVAAPKVAPPLVLGDISAFLQAQRAKNVKKIYIFGYDSLLEKLKTEQNADVIILQKYDDYSVTHLTLPFLNAKQRETVLGRAYLVEVGL